MNHQQKVVRSVAEALEPLRDGMTILCGGFGDAAQLAFGGAG